MTDEIVLRLPNSMSGDCLGREMETGLGITRKPEVAGWGNPDYLVRA